VLKTAAVFENMAIAPLPMEMAHRPQAKM